MSDVCANCGQPEEYHVPMLASGREYRSQEPLVRRVCPSGFYRRADGIIKTADGPLIIIGKGGVMIHPLARIDDWVKIEGGLGVTIDRGVHISSFAHVNIGGGQVIVEQDVAIASGARVFGGTNAPGGLSMSSAAPSERQRVVRRTTRICRDAMVGAGATVMPGVTVGEAAIVAAGAVATEDVPPQTIVAGVPARRIATRYLTADGSGYLVMYDAKVDDVGAGDMGGGR